MNQLIKKECQLTEFQKTIQVDSLVTRRKRGAIDVIGNIAADFFGVLDSRYAVKIEETFRTLKSNQNNNINLIKQHTSILEQTAKILKENQEATNMQFQDINSHLNELGAATATNSNNIKFNNLIEFLSLAIQKYRETQLIIHNVLKDFKNGKINPMLMSPDEFEDELKVIQSTLGFHSQLPSTHYEELENLLDVAVVHGASCLIFSIDIPLLNTDRFLLYKLLPVPTMINDEFVSLNPITDYMAINAHRNEYYFMNSVEYSNCKFMRESTICEEKHSVYHINNEAHCELQIYLNPLKIQPNCKRQIFSHHPIWIELQQRNSWIFAVKKEERAKIVCGNNVDFAVLKDEGVITVEPGCSIETKNTRLVGRKTTISFHIIKRIPPVLPHFNITLFDSGELGTDESNLPLVIKLSDSTKQITESLEIVKLQQNQNQEFNEFLRKPTLHDCLSYGFFVILLVGITFYFMRNYFTSCINSKVPPFTIPDELRRSINTETTPAT